MDAANAAPAPPSALASLRSTPLSLLLMGACLAVQVVVAASGSADDAAALVRLGAAERGRIWSGEPWRLVTATFVHAGPGRGLVHLALNLLVGFPLSRLAERALGPARLGLVYLASAAGATALSVLGQDHVTVGASGPILGLLGAILTLHARALGWRAFVRSGGTWLVLGALAASHVLAVLVPAGLPVDLLAHAGGLLTGAALAAALSARPGRRVPSSAAVAAALAALVVAAAWPRAEETRFERAERDARSAAVRTALRAGDAAGARRSLAEAEAHGDRSDLLDYYRGLLAVQEGDLERALVVLRDVAARTEGPLRAEVRERQAGVARLLGYRRYTGDGAAKDEVRGLLHFEEACAAGDEESCGTARAIRGR